MYSQKREDDFIWNYFKDKEIGNLLDIGANDGRLFSNSLLLIEKGWGGVLVEPSLRAFEKLQKFHNGNPKIILCQGVITDHDGMCIFHESGAIRVRNRPPNVGLASTIHDDCLPYWKNQKVKFNSYEVPCLSFKTFFEQSPVKKFDFVTIDAEGEDYNILKQIDLNKLGCQLLCVEYDKIVTEDDFTELICPQGFRKLMKTEVNLIFGK